MTDEQLKFLAYLINPWNAAVVLVVVLAIELLKRSFKEFFSNGNVGNKLLRIMCVGGCIVGYFVPGPWIDSDATFVARLFMGGLLGLVTTMGFEFIGGIVNAFKRLIFRKNAESEAKAAGAWIDTAKKLGTILGALAAGISAFYGAWFKPEDRAQAAYEVTSEGIEALSRDVQRLTTIVGHSGVALTELDKMVAVELAKLTQRMDYMETDLERRLSYEPAVIVEEVVGGGGVAMSAASPAMSHMPAHAPPDMWGGDVAVEMMVEDMDVAQQKRPQIKRKGVEIEMPAAEALF